MFNKLDKEVYDIAEAAKKVMQKEVEEPRAKGEKDFKNMHTKKKVVIDDPEQDPKNAKGVVYKMSEGKMKDLHALVGKGVKDPKKITKELGLPDTKEVHKAIASIIAGMKESKLDPVNKKAVKKKFANRKDKDIDNDGDVDSSDEYLHKRRKAISKATSENSKKKVAEAHLAEKNDALYLIYKDKIKAMQVRNFIKKQYRNKTEVEYAPMDAKNFGVSVFSDRGQADKIKKVVDKKFGKPDDFMLESV